MKEQMEKLIAELVAGDVFFVDAVSEFEKRFIRRVLELNHGNQSQAAKALGIHRNTLGRKMDQYKMNMKNGTQRAVAVRRKSRKKTR